MLHVCVLTVDDELVPLRCNNQQSSFKTRESSVERQVASSLPDTTSTAQRRLVHLRFTSTCPALIQTVPHEVISVRLATDVLKKQISSSDHWVPWASCGGETAQRSLVYSFGPEIRQEDPPNLSI